jgi:RNA polymerase sigma factor (sigma-70 family)
MPRSSEPSSANSFLHRVANHPLLTEAETAKLSYAIRDGAEARGEIACALLPALVRAVATEETADLPTLTGAFLETVDEMIAAEQRPSDRNAFMDAYRRRTESYVASSQDERIDCVIAQGVPFKRLPEVFNGITGIGHELRAIRTALARSKQVPEREQSRLRLRLVNAVDETAKDDDKLLRVIRAAAKLCVPLTERSWRRSRHRIGDAQRATSELVRCNGRLAIALAKKYTRSGLGFETLITTAQIGVMKGAPRFNPDLGWKFSTYVTWWIRHELQRTVMDEGRVVRIPVHATEILNRMRRAEKVSVEPLTDEQLAAAARTTPEKVGKMRPLLQSEVSLHARVKFRKRNDADNEETWQDFLPDDDATPEEALLRKQRDTLLLRLLDVPELKSIERTILLRRFGIDDRDEETLREIGDDYNLSRERIRQLESDGLKKLRPHAARLGLDAFL